MSWRLLQLEPTALRNPDSFTDSPHVGTDGAHLAATLLRLAKSAEGEGAAACVKDSAACVRVANRLSHLIDDVRSVQVHEDPQRELLTLQVSDRHGNVHAAQSLSDGTLRFLALAILEQDPEDRGLLCFEEPENGIHPLRIPAMLKLLKSLCMDVDEEVGPDNPLRQVIVNTHSPSVVALSDDADLVAALPHETLVNGHRCRTVRFAWLSDTWRADTAQNASTVSRGDLGAYLNPLAADEDSLVAGNGSTGHKQPRRVKDRDDLQMMLPMMNEP